jgi:predicted transcriptional regulator of viral defense system
VNYRQTVREIALDQYGYVTTTDAVDAGVPAVELRKLAGRGALINVAYGLYRLADARPTEYDQFAEALLRVGDGAYLRGDAVLALHHLALVNPRRIRVVVARRARAALPDFIDLREEERPESELTDYEGLRSTTVAEALLDCRDQVMTERLVDAAKQAKAEGLLTGREYARVRRALTRETQPA